MATPKQKYAIYRDNDLIASDMLSLDVINKYVKKDARNEIAHGRTALYVIVGSLGLKRTAQHFRGKLRWESGFSTQPHPTR